MTINVRQTGFRVNVEPEGHLSQFSLECAVEMEGGKIAKLMVVCVKCANLSLSQKTRIRLLILGKGYKHNLESTAICLYKPHVPPSVFVSTPQLC